MDITKFAARPDGCFEVITLADYQSMIENGLVVNSHGNRESGKLEGRRYANFMRRLMTAGESWLNLEQSISNAKTSAEANALKQEQMTNLGDNDDIKVIPKDGKIEVFNGYHRTLTIAELSPTFEFPRLSGDRSDPDVIWYNETLAGQSLLALGDIGTKILSSPICLKKSPNNPLHLIGSNRNKSSDGAENVHYLYHNTKFALAFRGQPIFYRKPDCPEYMAMYMFCQLAHISGSNSDCVNIAFPYYQDSDEAIAVAKDAVSWYKRFNFLCRKQAKGHTSALNVHKFKAMCRLAYERLLDNNFSLVEDLIVKHNPSLVKPVSKDIVSDFLSSSKTTEFVDVKVELARMVMDELFAMTPALRMADSSLDDIPRTGRNASDSAAAGIEDWLREYSVRSVLRGVGL